MPAEWCCVEGGSPASLASAEILGAVVPALRAEVGLRLWNLLINTRTQAERLFAPATIACSSKGVGTREMCLTVNVCAVGQWEVSSHAGLNKCCPPPPGNHWWRVGTRRPCRSNPLHPGELPTGSHSRDPRYRKRHQRLQLVLLPDRCTSDPSGCDLAGNRPHLWATSPCEGEGCQRVIDRPHPLFIGGMV